MGSRRWRRGPTGSTASNSGSSSAARAAPCSRRRTAPRRAWCRAATRPPPRPDHEPGPANRRGAPVRRLVGIAVVALAVVGSVVLGIAASGGGSGYEVRAIFDNVASAVPGEDVKVAGAKVGVIESMDVTPDKRAAVVLRIDDARFTPFRADATCTVRPQSLI